MVTKDVIMKMGVEARIDTMKYRVDTLQTLINKYKALLESNDYIEESVKQLIEEQERMTFETVTKTKSEIEVMDMVTKMLLISEETG